MLESGAGTTKEDSRTARPADVSAVWDLLTAVPDPEIPVLSVVELGIVRDVQWRDEELVVTVTPTYSGCPATEAIVADIERVLSAGALGRYRVETRLAPPWTTDWIALSAREKLARFGIAPPGPASGSGHRAIDTSALARRRYREPVPCPRCASTNTRELSRFGSTPCKAQYRCEACLEPFDYFKPH